jgi:hypothetical protein
MDDGSNSFQPQIFGITNGVCPFVNSMSAAYRLQVFCRLFYTSLRRCYLARFPHGEGTKSFMDTRTFPDGIERLLQAAIWKTA